MGLPLRHGKQDVAEQPLQHCSPLWLFSCWAVDPAVLTGLLTLGKQRKCLRKGCASQAAPWQVFVLRAGTAPSRRKADLCSHRLPSMKWRNVPRKAQLSSALLMVFIKLVLSWALQPNALLCCVLLLML